MEYEVDSLVIVGEVVVVRISVGDDAGEVDIG